MLLEEFRPSQDRGNILVPELSRFRRRITFKAWHFVGCVARTIFYASSYYGHFYFGMYLYEGTRQYGGYGYRLCVRCGYRKKVAIVLSDPRFVPADC